MEHHWRTDKIIPLDEAQQKAAELKRAGKKVVTANGTFDLLHAGHVDLLEEAKQQGDVLFLGINSDTSVREKKGESRPYVPEHERAAMLAALACVDYVIVIDAPYDGGVTTALLNAIQPNIHVNGSEYGAPQTWIEWPIMQKVGASAHTVQRRPGLATTDLINKIRG